MFFFQLGFMNAQRSLKRSMIALTAMAVAAAFFTYSLGLDQGYPLFYKADCRTVIGGEIVAYAHQFGGAIPEGESRWYYTYTPKSPRTDLEVFYPELLKYGYLSQKQGNTEFTPEDVRTLLDGHPEFKAIYPRYQMPIYSVCNTDTDDSVNEATRRSAPLRGRDAAVDTLLVRSPQQLVVAGRWFEPQDDGALVAVVSRDQNLPEGSEAPRVGETIVIEIPRVRYVGDEIEFVEKKPLLKELTIIGQYSAMLRYSEVDGEPIYVPWTLDEILIPLATWHTLWSEAGGKDYHPEQLTILMSNLSRVQDKVRELRLAFPQYTFFSTPELLDQAEARGLLEQSTEQGMAADNTLLAVSDMTLDLRAAISLLLFVNAAIILAAHQLILAADRQRESVILIALGASQMQIVIMVVAEAVLLTLIGIGCGFGAFRFPVAMIQLSNAVSFGVVLQSIFDDLVLLTLISLIFTVFFSLLPAIRIAKQVMAEVSSND